MTRPPRRPRTALPLPALAALALPAALLAGCSSGGGTTAGGPASTGAALPTAPATTLPATDSPPADGGATATASPSVSVSPSPSVSVSPSPSPSPTRSAGLDRCHTSQLRLSLGQGQGAAGTIYTPLVVTNTSGVTCTVTGYPGAQLVDAQRRFLPTTVVRDTSVPPQRVVLRPGQAASALASYSDVSSGGACAESTYLEVTPPDERDYLFAPARIAACRGQLRVRPFVPGTQG